jgi:YidC/Oxa1 family membrane protein insertase
VAVDENYMFTVTQRVENTGGEAVTLHPYALVSRHGTPQTSGFFILHEGPIGVFDNTLREVDYDELREEGVISQATTGGWIGITDKYWLAAVIPDQNDPVEARFVHQRSDNIDIYQTDFTGGAVAIGPGETVESTSRIFAGAKRAQLLDHYAQTYNIAHFDRAIDFGWFYFLTKPLFYFLIYIQRYVGNFGIAILVLTVVIKLLFFPLANKSYKAMSQMRRLQPEMLKLRERFGDDKMRLNQEMMALYKREKVSPASGCLPMLIQIPVFFALYKVLFVTIEMRHAPFFGWINDLSAPDPTSIFNLFGLIPVDLPQFLIIGAWPLIMGVTMYLQQKLNPQPPDPMQAKIFMMLPVIFTFMLAQFPAGLVIYWTWNNVLSIIQQWVIMRRTGGAGGGITAASP